MTSEQMATVERLTLRRARGAIVIGALFLISMATSLRLDIGDSRPATVQIVASVVWAGALLFLVAAGGGLFRGHNVRGLMNDDSTIENRRNALVTGFWAFVFCAFMLFLISLFESLSGRLAIRIMLSVAVGVAAIRFGILERRALRLG
jgi:protein-S-isoprenylcysteine O-methyltransferase Ste14